ncbi:hypothetical protein F4802DRAFT_620652 [Xylaria palmicola]|nr:hypothetical protein F4802DRAFT_620652 [Xylaria palmicola]
MFPIDALLVVDAQNDFLAEDGALPVKMPIDLCQRIGELADSFRRNGGEVIWVQSRFESSRPVEAEPIMIADTPSPPSGSVPPPRGRRSRTATPAAESPPSPEAFLTQGAGQGPSCVRAGAPGTEMHPVIKQAVGPKDHVLTKSFYSAFKSEELLRVLRVRLVTELFICGSMTNVGVMATAIDAASHGYTITIVDDCCGSQSMSRHRAALRQIASMTGCDTLSAAKVLGVMRPMPTAMAPDRVGNPHQRQDRGAPGGRSPTVRLRRGKKDAVAASVSDIQPSLERLSLSGQPAATDGHAPKIIASQHDQRQQQQPQSRSQSQSQSPSALQSMARSDHPQAQKQADRDSVASTDERPPAANGDISAVARRTAASIKTTDDGRNESVRSDDEAVGADSPTPTWGSISPTGRRSQQRAPQSEPLCEGDTKVVYDVLPAPLAEDGFARIRDEVSWQRMSHQGGEVPRLVAVQGCVEVDGSKPVYRHPADESPPLRPFTPAVDEIRRIVEARLGHPLNHVLIQLYRGGTDYISEHSDKTLDIARGSFIANVSLGAERTMTLRTKRRPKDAAVTGVPEGGEADGLQRQIQRARLPHNSLFRMGLATNMRWMHAIRPDKRQEREKTEAERAFAGARISLTFRRIATFLDAEETCIWGQGASGKARLSAAAVVNGQTDQAVGMLRAFGRENQAAEFDWAAHYGPGFDVLHIGDAKRLFLSADRVVNERVRILLAELGISYARGSFTGGVAAETEGAASDHVAIKFADNDASKTAVMGQRDIMLYLEKTYGSGAEDIGERARERFDQGLGFLDTWRSSSPPSVSRPPASEEARTEDEDVAKIQTLLSPWERYAAEDAFIAGPAPGLADFAFWPVLHDIFASLTPSPSSSPTGLENGSRRGEEDMQETPPGKKAMLQVPHLAAYHDRMRRRDAVAQVLGRP